MRHCNEHWQTQFNRQFFVANQAGVGGVQANFLSLTSALDFSDFVRDVIKCKRASLTGIFH